MMVDPNELRDIAGNADWNDYEERVINQAADDIEALRDVEKANLSHIKQLKSKLARLREELSTAQAKLAEARGLVKRHDEQNDLLWLATINEWKFSPDWDSERTGCITMDVGHDCFTPPASKGDYSQAVKNAIKYVLDDGRDEIEDYKGIVAAIEAARKQEGGNG